MAGGGGYLKSQGTLYNCYGGQSVPFKAHNSTLYKFNYVEFSFGTAYHKIITPRTHDNTCRITLGVMASKHPLI